MKLDETTKIKIMKLIKVARKFMDKYNDLDNPDIVFIITGFEIRLNSIAREIETGTFDTDKFHDTIFEYDSIMFECIDSLPFRPKTYENGNSIYDVLFSILHGINGIVENYLITADSQEENREVSEPPLLSV